MPVDAILGLQWGDEGKGKIVDYLAKSYKAVARFQGGPNAGHTLYLNDKKFVLHTLPSGIFNPEVMNIIGNGVVIDPITLEREIKQVIDIVPDITKRLLVANRAHLILPTHRWIDIASEHAKDKMKIGSTLKGIGPCYMDKTGRNGLRLGDIHENGFLQQYKAIKEKHIQFIRQFPEVDFNLRAEEENWMAAIDNIRKLNHGNTEYYIHELLKSHQPILAEGAQGTMLDVDFGTYPFVTSSNTIAAGICTGLGAPPSSIRKVIGIAKAYCTRVGSGPFPTELTNEIGEILRKEGREFGSTTGRPRRCGWLDLVQLKYSVMVNGVNELCLTKIDVLNNFTEIGLCTSYALSSSETTDLMPFKLESIKGAVTTNMMGWNQSLANCSKFSELPQQADSMIRFIENYVGLPVTLLSNGPGRDQLIIR